MNELLQGPTISAWMSEEETVLRQQAREYLQRAANSGLLASRKIDRARVFPSGDTSVVFLIESPQLTYVTKMASHPETVETEAVFLKQWQEQGVKTPQVLALHTVDDQLPISILSLEYIETPVLSTLNTEQRVEKGIAREMGRTLARMHNATGEGFGLPVSNNKLQGCFTTFREEQQKLLEDDTSQLIKAGLLTNEDLIIARTAVDIMEDDLQAGRQPSLTHNDFRPYNIFYTEPLTIFDPDPRITHPYMCLALSLIKAEVRSNPYGKSEASEILSGYSETGEIQDRVLSAAMVLRGMRTLSTWTRKGKAKNMKGLLELIRRQQNII